MVHRNLEVPKRTHNETRQPKGNYTRRKVPSLPGNALPSSSRPTRRTPRPGNTTCKRNRMDGYHLSRMLPRSQVVYTQHSTRRRWNTKQGSHLDMGSRSRRILPIHQQMYPNGLPPERIPPIDLTNTTETWKGGLLQSLHLETSTPPQHDGQMDRKDYCNKTPILRDETRTDPPKPVWRHAREINYRCSIMPSSRHTRGEQPQPLH